MALRVSWIGESVQRSQLDRGEGIKPRRGSAAYALLRGLVFDVLYDIADSLKFLSVFVRDFDGEFLFESHDQFDSVERVRAQILDELGAWRDLLRIYAELFNDDVLDSIFNAFFCHKM